jgi:hypothetical protein
LKGIIDTIFSPFLNWLNSIYNSIMSLEVPLSRPINIGEYLGIFGYLGPYWISFIVTAGLLGFIYIVCFIVVAQQGLIIKFKDTIKWW